MGIAGPFPIVIVLQRVKESPVSLISQKTHCPKPGCDGEFMLTGYTGIETEVNRYICTNVNCDYEKHMIVGGPFRGNGRYYRNGEAVKFTWER